MKLLKKYKALLVEILIVLVVLPSFAGIISAYSEQAKELFFNVISEIDIFNIWFEMLTDLFESNDIRINFQNYLKNWLTIASESSLIIYIIGVLSDLVERFISKLTGNELKILPKIAVITVACVISSFTPMKAEYIIAEVGIIFLIYILLLKFVFKLRIGSVIFRVLFGIIIDIYIVCSVCTYIALLALIAIGRITGVYNIALMVIITFSMVLLSLVLKALFDITVQKKN